jgi:hypothetical protein
LPLDFHRIGLEFVQYRIIFLAIGVRVKSGLASLVISLRLG